MKLSKKEWLAWPIDIILLRYNQKQQVLQQMITQAEKKKQEEEEAKTIKENLPSIHTVSAIANGLTCV